MRDQSAGARGRAVGAHVEQAPRIAYGCAMIDRLPHGSAPRPSAPARRLTRLVAVLALSTLAACGNGTPSGAGPATTGGGPSAPSTTAASATTEPSATASAASATPTGEASAAASSTDAPSATMTAGASGTADAGAAQGAKRDADAYGAWLEAPKRVKAGSSTAAQAVLVAKEGYKCNDKYPFKFKLDPAPAGLSYPEPIAKGVTYGAKRTTLAIPVVADKPGSYTVSGTFSLSVCNETSCKIQREPLSVAIEVQ